jgi:hypothetical protein
MPRQVQKRRREKGGYGEVDEQKEQEERSDAPAFLSFYIDECQRHGCELGIT